jgi:DNA-binding NarL/FixJ family response regulator
MGEPAAAPISTRGIRPGPTYPGTRRHPLEALSEPERAILAIMADGLWDQAISDRLSLPASAVEDHLTEIFAKLGLKADARDHRRDHRRVLAVLAYLRA